MPRSGSTLLFNILRICLQQKYGQAVGTAWIDDYKDLSSAPAYLLKVHHVSWPLRLRSQHIFCSYRDVRDALLSAQRRFGVQPNIELCRAHIAEQQAAVKFSSLQFRYESFVDDLPSSIRQVAELLELEVNVADVLARLPTAKPQSQAAGAYDRETLLHDGHATNTQSGDWRVQFEPTLQAQIRSEFSWWFLANGYPLD